MANFQCFFSLCGWDWVVWSGKLEKARKCYCDFHCINPNMGELKLPTKVDGKKVIMKTCDDVITLVKLSQWHSVTIHLTRMTRKASTWIFEARNRFMFYHILSSRPLSSPSLLSHRSLQTESCPFINARWETQHPFGILYDELFTKWKLNEKLTINSGNFSIVDFTHPLLLSTLVVSSSTIFTLQHTLNSFNSFFFCEKQNSTIRKDWKVKSLSFAVDAWRYENGTRYVFVVVNPLRLRKERQCWEWMDRRWW